MKIKKTILIIAILLLIFLIPVLGIVTNENYTTKLSEKYGSKPELNKEIHNFLNNNEPLGDEFTEKEIDHMQDVKNIIFIAKILFVTSLTIIIYLRPTLKELQTASMISLALLIIILILTLTNFQATFTAFHNIFFEEGTWTFPYDSTLLQTYPNQFFVETSTTWFVASTGLSLILLASSPLLSYYKRTR